MKEVLVKTHLIITDTHHEYNINWCGRIADAHPKLENGLPVFVVIGSNGRIELNTIDMERIEKCAKLMTKPRGRAATTSDSARIFIKEEDGHEKLLGILTHKYVKEYAPMYDAVGYR